MFGDFPGWVGDVVSGLGYVGVAIVAAAESMVPPIAGPPMALVGVAVARGELAFFPAVAAATAGTTVGAWCWYALAALVGRDRLDRFLRSNQRWLRVDVADLHRAESWFERHADLTVLLGRSVPIVRSLVSIPAGLVRMPWWRFTLLTVAGAALWNAVAIGLGATLGASWASLAEWHPLLGAGALVVGIGLVAAAVVLTRRLRRRATTRLPSTDDREGPGQSAEVDATSPS